ncbi:MAG: hypothetical protein AAF710_03375 [Planctomycetota bacterium]
MKLRDDPPLPEGYESWRPRMGRGGRAVAWAILALIAGGTALMAYLGLAPWFR